MPLSKKPSLLVLAGTRPELLKLAPVLRAIHERGDELEAKTCFSGQHVEILDSVLGDVDVTPDIDLRAPSPGMSLSRNLARLLERVDEAVDTLRPDGVIVQGDTNTVLAGAMTAYHHQIPCFHVEAGLRTSDPSRPFPEEMNRRLVTRMAALHFAPTASARAALVGEGVDPETIFVTGNTGIDALRIYASGTSPEAEAILGKLRPGTRRILVTLHRRENSEAVSNVTAAVRRLTMVYGDVEVLWVLHKNGMRDAVVKSLVGHPSIHLLEPQSYRAFVHLMRAVDIILSDSGGVQEEAPALGTPVLVLRTETERPEAVEAGSAFLVGCDVANILRKCHKLLDNPAYLERVAQPRFPFGDGYASERIVEAIADYYTARSHTRLIPSRTPPPLRSIG